MDMNLQNLNQKNSYGKKIVVSFKNDYGYEKYDCFENDMTYKLIDKINPNYRWNLIKFVCNEKKLHPFLTLKENGIKDSSIITSKQARNIIFVSSYGRVNIAIDDNYPVKKAIKYFLLSIGKEGCFNNFIFLYNTQRINFENNILVKNVFKNNNNSHVFVNER